ncbi:unnamed protein product [Polarella glacialis]|uniref:Major facilitator superfamily (MFS) profile domain-containing protein n=1 Tax=Polarella glacialis TaxID=89957 RepID=A0A813GUQ2_POLGL|nr:unnamed protein product [Polarella glacialis]
MQHDDEAHRSFQRRTDRDGTVGTLCVLSMLNGADIQLLPSSFRAMEQDLHLTTASLAILALCQGLSCAITGPFWGNLVDAGMPRKTLLKVAVVLWGLCTISLGMVSHFYVMAFLRVLNGVALSALVPIVQSFVFDLSEPTSRGWLFGMLYFSSSIGQICTCLTVSSNVRQGVARHSWLACGLHPGWCHQPAGQLPGRSIHPRGTKGVGAQASWTLQRAREASEVYENWYLQGDHFPGHVRDNPWSRTNLHNHVITSNTSAFQIRFAGSLSQCVPLAMLLVAC